MKKIIIFIMLALINTCMISCEKLGILDTNTYYKEISAYIVKNPSGIDSIFVSSDTLEIKPVKLYIFGELKEFNVCPMTDSADYAYIKLAVGLGKIVPVTTSVKVDEIIEHDGQANTYWSNIFPRIGRIIK